MPGRSKRSSSKRLRRRLTLALLLTIALALVALLGYMRIAARTVYVRYATVTLRDLPPEFDGVKILFVTDVDLLTAADPPAAIALMQKLDALHPDLMLFGGDYASPTLFDRLNSGDGQAGASSDRQLTARARFISALAPLSAPLGKYAVAGETDLDPDSLRAVMQSAGVSLLQDEAALISRGDARIALVGLKDTGGDVTDLTSLASTVSGSECVLVLAHNPATFVAVQTAEAKNGGPWADLVLSGHTHGGQIMLGDKSAFALREYERRYISGWRREGGVAQLTSSGLGCTGANLRLGTQAEVHFITLKRGIPKDDAPSPTFAPLNDSARWLPDN